MTIHHAKPKLLAQVRDLLRTRHYALATEKNYLLWIRRFILFHDKKHPATLPRSAVSEFLTHLAVDLHVSASTQNQALNALVFLYRHVLRQDLGELEGIEWAKRREHIPVVLTRDEVQAIIGRLRGTQPSCILLQETRRLPVLRCEARREVRRASLRLSP